MGKRQTELDDGLDTFDDFEAFSLEEIGIDDFLDTQPEPTRRGGKRKRGRDARRRLEEMALDKALRRELYDWDDDEYDYGHH